MTQYNVTGMSCAACSARVEKAVSKVPGVTSCSVSLLTNSMGVEGTASDRAIISAVQKPATEHLRKAEVKPPRVPMNPHSATQKHQSSKSVCFGQSDFL